MISALKPFEKKSELIIFFSLLGFIIAMPLLNSAGAISSYQLGNWGKYLCYAVVAMSLNMLWGYTGLLCLGQCLFFALGGYAFGMYLMLMIGELGQYQSSLPDFMVFLGYEKLPAHWVPFYSPWFAILMVMVVPGTVAFTFGLGCHVKQIAESGNRASGVFIFAWWIVV